MSNEIIKMLDRVASSLEENGLIKEAAELDVIANTIEASILSNIKNNLKSIANRLGIRTLPKLKDAISRLQSASSQQLDEFLDMVKSTSSNTPFHDAAEIGRNLATDKSPLNTADYLTLCNFLIGPQTSDPKFWGDFTKGFGVDLASVPESVTSLWESKDFPEDVTKLFAIIKDLRPLINK